MLTKEEKRMAQLHATAWEKASQTVIENAGRRSDIDQNAMRAFATIAMIIGGEYRKIVNKNEFEA